MIFRAAAFLICTLAASAQMRGIDEVRRAFAQPPDNSRIMMRWWWFGPAVEKPELERELRAMKAAGIGGVEIQPVYPLDLDDPQKGFRNLPYLSDEFIDALRFANDKARELGLRVDITLGSGWPYGGRDIPINEAAGRLRVVRSTLTPSLENGEEIIGNIDGTFFIASRTGQQVKRAGVGAEGFVLDHYDRAAIEDHLRVVADRLMQAFGSHPPEAVFSDSLEVYGSDWTPKLLEEFKKRRGYDLAPRLPALVGDIGDQPVKVRHDWGQTLTELAEENYLTPIREWAHAHGTRFRSQTYGIPPVRLSSNALVDLPEGEGAQWDAFSTTRWASSASHLFGRNVTSSETWTWLHSPSFRATPLDLKAEADRHFLQGINQIVGHGWPYSPPSAGEPGWRLYAGAALNDHNPWWIAMPDVAKYLQRVSFVLRQGEPANDIALYLPTDDAWSGFMVGSKFSINEAMPALLGPDLIPQILRQGFNFDFIDDVAIEKLGIRYPVLVLPNFRMMPDATRARIDEYKRKGGIVVNASDIADLANRYTPDFTTSNPAIGFIHRRLPDADVYFVVNTSNQPVSTLFHAHSKYARAEFWDPLSGAITAALADGGILLAPYESQLLVFTANSTAPWLIKATEDDVRDISAGWETNAPQDPFFSGVVRYVRNVAIGRPDGHVLLNLGYGTPVLPTRLANGMRAWLESPVREAAVIYVNDKRAGSVWCPPYEIDITGFIHPGTNSIRIDVGNLAINELARQSSPDYRLLKLRYGDRFQPQDMDHLEPLPYGLLGGVRLISR